VGFLFDDTYAIEFQLFGWLHILVLLLAAGSLVALYYLRDRLTSPTVGRIFRFTVATLMVVLETIYQVWNATLHGLQWAEVVPLGLCAMMEWITVIALLFDLQGVIKVVLPWAFLGSTLSFIVVNMGTTAYGPPHFRFFHYFGIHWLFLVGNLFYLFTGRFTYTYRDLLRSTAWLSGVSAVVLAIDLAVKENFMFLRDWPDEMAFFKPYLPFPLNTVLLMFGAFLLFNVFYLVFVIKRFDAPAERAVTR
jgi:hypothetical integral membrane protein (TIGR02206 family)